MRVKLFQRCLLYSLIPCVVLIRIFHNYNWSIWGSDTGEYLYLTRELVSNGKMLSEGYLGWGRAYPDFQGMQIVAGTVSLVANIDYNIALLWFIPMMSALSMPILFFIGKEISGFTPALFASAFYSATFAVVFANSHAMPGGLAEPIGFLLLLNWIKILKSDKIWIINPAKRNPWANMMKFSFFALLITHHFTLLLLMAAILGILIVEIAAGNKKISTEGIMVVGLMSLPISVYWLIYAKSFRKMLDDSAFDFLPESVPVTIVLTLIPLITLLILWVTRDYLQLPLIKNNITKQAMVNRICVTIAISFVAIIVVLWRGVPGTIAPLQAGEYQALPYLLINVLWISFAANASLVTSQRYGWLLWGWILPIMALATIGAVTESHLLIAYRHAPYILAPLSLIAGIGFMYFIRSYENNKRPIIATSVIAIFIACAFMSYPPPSVMGGFQEGTNPKEIDAILWTGFAEKDSLVVSDHRLSSLTFGLTKTNASWENGATVINGNKQESKEAAKELSTPQAGVKKVNYVLVSAEMEKGVALLQRDPAKELTGEAKTKFKENNDFPIWFDNGDTTIMRMNPD